MVERHIPGRSECDRIVVLNNVAISITDLSFEMRAELHMTYGLYRNDTEQNQVHSTEFSLDPPPPNMANFIEIC